MHKKILLVEDSRTDMAYLRSIISGAGHVAIEATSGRQAVELANIEQPDIIFMDIVMQGEDGYDACREIKASRQTRSIPVIFVTSKQQKADRVWAELQGAKGFITKPYEPQQILDEIEKNT